MDRIINPFVRLLPKGNYQSAVFRQGLVHQPSGEFDGLAAKGIVIDVTLNPQDTQDFLMALAEGFVLTSIAAYSTQTAGFGYKLYDTAAGASYADRPVTAGLVDGVNISPVFEPEPYAFEALPGKAPQCQAELTNYATVANRVWLCLRGSAKGFPTI